MDLTSGLSANINWSEAYIVKGNDGSAWQRAIINNPRQGGAIELKEGEEAIIEGIARANNDIQIFIYAKEDNGSGGVKKPTIADCKYAGKSSSTSYFSYTLSPQVLWDSVDGEIIIDAFFRMEESWDQAVPEATNQNFYIGTHIPPVAASVNVEYDEEIEPGRCS